MRLFEPGSDRYWEGWREDTTVRWLAGTEGGKARESRKEFSDEAAAEKDLQARRRARFREGMVFRGVEGTSGWRPALMAPVSRVHTGFYSLDFSPTTGLIAAGRPNQEGDGPPCELLLIDAVEGTVRQALALKALDLWQARFDPLGRGVYVRADGKVARVDLTTEERSPLFATPPFTFLDFCLSRDGRRLLGSDHSRLVVLDLESGERLVELPLCPMSDYRQNRTAALSPSGRLAALCQEAGRIELIDLPSGDRRTLTGDFPHASRLVIHPSDGYLVMAEHYADRALRVIEVESGKEVPRFCPPGSGAESRWPCTELDVSGDGGLLARGAGYHVFLHDWETGEVAAELKQEFAVRGGGFGLTFAGTSDALLTRVDLGIVTLYRRQE